jgi:hypothetical protein
MDEEAFENEIKAFLGPYCASRYDGTGFNTRKLIDQVRETLT